MAVNIKNREVESFLAEIKAATGKGTSRIVLELVRKEADALRRIKESDKRKRRIQALSRRYSARLPKQPKTPDAIIGYDEDGLPR